MSETTSGKNLNLTLVGGIETRIRLKTFVDGQEVPLFGKTIMGEVRDIVTEAHLGFIAAEWDVDSPVLVFPALEYPQRCVFQVDIVDEGGEATRLVDGYVSYGEQNALKLPTQGGYPERNLNVLIGDTGSVVSWGKTTAAEVAYNKTFELSESISEDVEALKGAKDVIDKLHGEIADAVTIADDETWVIGGVRTDKPSRGERGRDGADGLDATAVHRLLINSYRELPSDAEHTSGRYVYYAPMGSLANAGASFYRKDDSQREHPLTRDEYKEISFGLHLVDRRYPALLTPAYAEVSTEKFEFLLGELFSIDGVALSFNLATMGSIVSSINAGNYGVIAEGRSESSREVITLTSKKPGIIGNFSTLASLHEDIHVFGEEIPDSEGVVDPQIVRFMGGDGPSESYYHSGGSDLNAFRNKVNSESEFVTVDTNSSDIFVWSKKVGHEWNNIYFLFVPESTDYVAVQQYQHLMNGSVDLDGRSVVYICVEEDGVKKWINLGDPAALQIATQDVFGVVKLSSPDVGNAYGAGIHRDSQGAIRVNDATTFDKGAVRITATGWYNEFEECIGNTQPITVSGRNLGKGIGVRRANDTDYGVVKKAYEVNGMDFESVPVSSAVSLYASSAAQEEINKYVDEAGDDGNALTELIDDKINSAVASVVPTPTGSVIAFAGEEAPEGWLICNGEELNRVDYSDLFSVIGVIYGTPSSDAVFKLPDLRGVFVRGVSENNAIGLKQTSAAPNITGTFSGVGTYGSSYEATLTGAMYRVNTAKYPDEGSKISNEGSKDDYFGFDASRSSAVYKDGVAEIRPANVAMNYIIKY